MADGMLISLKPRHQVNLTLGVSACRSRGAFLDSSLCAEEQAVSPQPGQKGTTGKSRPYRAELENLGHVRGDGDFPGPLRKGSQDLC